MKEGFSIRSPLNTTDDLFSRKGKAEADSKDETRKNNSAQKAAERERALLSAEIFGISTMLRSNPLLGH